MTDHLLLIRDRLKRHGEASRLHYQRRLGQRIYKNPIALVSPISFEGSLSSHLIPLPEDLNPVPLLQKKTETLLTSLYTLSTNASSQRPEDSSLIHSSTSQSHPPSDPLSQSNLDHPNPPSSSNSLQDSTRSRLPQSSDTDSTPLPLPPTEPDTISHPSKRAPVLMKEKSKEQILKEKESNSFPSSIAKLSQGRNSILSQSGILQSPSNLSPEMKRGFLLDPLPKGYWLETRVRRESKGIVKKSFTYTLELNDGDFLLRAIQQSDKNSSNFHIFMNTKANKVSEQNFVGKLKSNFGASEYYLYGPGYNPERGQREGIKTKDGITELDFAEEEYMKSGYDYGDAVHYPRDEHCLIKYDKKMFSSGNAEKQGGKLCHMYLPALNSEGSQRKLYGSGKGRFLSQTISNAKPKDNLSDLSPPDTIHYTNKPPVWNPELRCYAQDYNKRVSMTSSKNIQLIEYSAEKEVKEENIGEPISEKPTIQFGKVSKEYFILDFQHPFSPMQAFALALAQCDGGSLFD